MHTRHLTSHSLCKRCDLGCRCVKAMVGESCSAQGQARPLSYLSLAWGLGTIVGPAVGGVLSRPCSTFGHRFPLCHSGQLFDAR